MATPVPTALRRLAALALTLVIALPALVTAQDRPTGEGPPPPPFIEDRPSDKPIAEPEVRIIQRPDQVVEEYRLNGQLYMIRVIPKKGPPYYLLDADGDGNLETRTEELDPKVMVPGWVIFRW